MTSIARAPDRPVPTVRAAGLRDALITIGALILALDLVEVAVPSISRGVAGSLLDGVVVVSFTVTGLVAWYRRPHNATGRLMVATAVAVWAAGMQDDQVDAMRTVGLLTSTVPLALLLHLLLAFPSGRLAGRAARIIVAAGYAVALVPQVVLLLAPTTDSVTWTVQAVGGLGTLVATFVLASRRLATMPAPLRRQRLPFVGYGCLAIALIAVTVVVIHLSTDPTMGTVAQALQLVVLCGLPFAFVAGLTRGAFGRAGEVEEVARGISQASVEPALLDDLMARTLGDPSARVLWNTGDPDGYVDSGGTVQDVPPDRGVWPVGGGQAPVGTLVYDRAVVDDRNLVASVAAPLELAMAHRRVVVDLRSAVQQLNDAALEIRTSRRRIVVAADAERRRIARDLHDGAQQRVVLVGIEVQRLGRRADDPDVVRSAVPRIAAICESLLDDLRSLVQGIMPSRLQDRGLEAAVRGLADELPVPVRVEIEAPLGRMDAEVESTGYFVVAEALTNAMKHAQATEIVVTIRVRDARMRVEVRDDGTGADGAVPGFGLGSLEDRVEALDGTVELRATPGGGTSLVAEFACA